MVTFIKLHLAWHISGFVCATERFVALCGKLRFPDVKHVDTSTTSTSETIHHNILGSSVPNVYTLVLMGSQLI
jgi:hypothetical protein